MSGSNLVYLKGLVQSVGWNVWTSAKTISQQQQQSKSKSLIKKVLKLENSGGEVMKKLFEANLCLDFYICPIFNHQLSAKYFKPNFGNSLL